MGIKRFFGMADGIEGFARKCKRKGVTNAKLSGIINYKKRFSPTHGGGPIYRDIELELHADSLDNDGFTEISYKENKCENNGCGQGCERMYNDSLYELLFKWRDFLNSNGISTNYDGKKKEDL